MNSRESEPQYFIRMTLSQRIQHALLFISFLLLALTGLPLRFATNPIAQGMVNAMGGYTARAIIHRAAAVIMIAVALYHFGAIGLGIWQNRRKIHEEGIWAFPMVWNYKDWTDIRQAIRYYMRIDNEPPKYGKFSYVEKVEYWSLLWGTVIMILSGLILWFPFRTLHLLPGWVINIALIVHSYEAALAISAIVIWHMYTVHLSPDHFPMNWTWITGKISAEELKEHHPLEYERLMRERKQTSGPAEK